MCCTAAAWSSMPRVRASRHLVSRTSLQKLNAKVKQRYLKNIVARMMVRLSPLASPATWRGGRDVTSAIAADRRTPRGLGARWNWCRGRYISPISIDLFHYGGIVGTRTAAEGVDSASTSSWVASRATTPSPPPP